MKAAELSSTPLHLLLYQEDRHIKRYLPHLLPLRQVELRPLFGRSWTAAKVFL